MLSKVLAGSTPALSANIARAQKLKDAQSKLINMEKYQEMTAQSSVEESKCVSEDFSGEIPEIDYKQKVEELTAKIAEANKSRDYWFTSYTTEQANAKKQALEVIRLNGLIDLLSRGYQQEISKNSMNDKN